MRGLRRTVEEKLLNTVLRTVKHPNDWKVLVLDKLSMRMISACCKMHEIMAEGITIVEDIEKKREPLQNLEAIYLITPSKQSIDYLIEDFEHTLNPRYRAAHVFFTEACPEDQFNRLTRAEVARKLRTCKEINIAFLPYESQVFSLDSSRAFRAYFHPGTGPFNNSSERSQEMERLAEQIATLCSTLGEYPAVRYRADYERNLELARLVQQKLDTYKADDSSMGQGVDKAKSQLLILDRGVDCITPLLHELTIQAMAYDLLPIENDVYKYASDTNNDEPTKEVLLDENDELWQELRHKHIADVMKSVSAGLKTFMHDKQAATPTDKTINIKDLSQMIKKMPQYQKELNRYSTNLHLAEDCMKIYKSKELEKLCRAEQDLAVGQTAQGEKVKDSMRAIVPIMLDNKYSPHDKLRLMILYVLSIKTGVPTASLDQLIQHAQLRSEDKTTIANIQNLGVTVFNDNKRKTWQMPRKERAEQTYDLSRWVPVVKDIMEEAIEGRLDATHFPFLTGQPPALNASQMVGSARQYGQWSRTGQGAQQQRSGPRLIVFIAGGVTYAEMRCAYEVTAQYKQNNWEVIVGSSQLMPPELFIENLNKLSD